MKNNSFLFELGNFKCIAVSDGTFTYSDQSFYQNAPKEQLQKVFREYDLQSGQITTPYTCLFIDTGKHRILVDTGMGAGVVPSVGNLLMNLQEEGIEGADIDTVILTHGHPDHIGGIINAEGKPAFPNARYVMWKKEWEFWASEPDLKQLKVDEHIKQIILMSARKNLPSIKNRLNLIDHEIEILPGIHAISAPGHTPGHIALGISSGVDNLRKRMAMATDLRCTTEKMDISIISLKLYTCT
jgi:glyoxylase-like metal-dependent hydrolase (beta-lactamase superfamily II)